MTLPANVRAAFPALASGEKTSEATWRYNCHAWGGDRDDAWWAPDGRLPFMPTWVRVYWPPGLPQFDLSVENFQNAFATIAFVSCANGELEESSEKIALYVKANRVTHTARQLPSGRWTSKLGRDVDIVHPTPAALEGGVYGHVAGFMARPRQAVHVPESAGLVP
jgi:hypothetical protein